MFLCSCVAHKYGQTLCFYVLLLSINMDKAFAVQCFLFLSIFIDRPYVLCSCLVHRYGQTLCFFVLFLPINIDKAFATQCFLFLSIFIDRPYVFLFFYYP
jgi:hypothetical protein